MDLCLVNVELMIVLLMHGKSEGPKLVFKKVGHGLLSRRSENEHRSLKSYNCRSTVMLQFYAVARRSGIL
jgi:hypothetical protein